MFSGLFFITSFRSAIPRAAQRIRSILEESTNTTCFGRIKASVVFVKKNNGNTKRVTVITAREILLISLIACVAFIISMFNVPIVKV